MNERMYIQYVDLYVCIYVLLLNEFSIKVLFNSSPLSEIPVMVLDQQGNSASRYLFTTVAATQQNRQIFPE